MLRIFHHGGFSSPYQINLDSNKNVLLLGLDRELPLFTAPPRSSLQKDQWFYGQMEVRELLWMRSTILRTSVFKI